jgi:hypothetical protein
MAVLYGATMLVLASVQERHSDATTIWIAGGVTIAIAGLYVWSSIGILRGQRWAWITSVALDGVATLSFLSLPFVARHELSAAAIFGAPLCVTIGLLVGGRRAVFAPAAKAAAEPTSATLRGV